MYTNNTIPVITKSTRIITSQFVSGIELYDISDHLPGFCIVNTPIRRNKTHFNADSYLDDMRRINWNDKLSNLSTDLNKTTQDVIDVINEITNKHVPIKEASQSKLKQLNKP